MVVVLKEDRAGLAVVAVVVVVVVMVMVALLLSVEQGSCCKIWQIPIHNKT